MLQAANCHRGESLSLNMALTTSSSAATPEAVRVCMRKPQRSVMGYTSISSSSLRSFSRSWGEMGSSFKKAATRSPAQPW